MKNYSSISLTTGKPTGILGYDYNYDTMIIHFTSGAKYTYTIASCGTVHLSKMKQLADSQRGLNTYLTKYKPPYASKNV